MLHPSHDSEVVTSKRCPRWVWKYILIAINMTEKITTYPPPLDNNHISRHCLNGINVSLVLTLPWLIGVNGILSLESWVIFKKGIANCRRGDCLAGNIGETWRLWRLIFRI
jgi:hypothetical protein